MCIEGNHSKYKCHTWSRFPSFKPSERDWQTAGFPSPTPFIIWVVNSASTKMSLGNKSNPVPYAYDRDVDIRVLIEVENIRGTIDFNWFTSNSCLHVTEVSSFVNTNSLKKI